VIEPDATMTRVGEGMQLSHRGERQAARQLFDEVWNQIGGDSGDPFHRCALAHAMADVQDDVHQELIWDMRALEAADLITRERAVEAGVTSQVRGFYPSCISTSGSAIASLVIWTAPGSTFRRVGPLSGRSATMATPGW